MQFKGEVNLAPRPEQAWTRLSDVRFLVQCIPGAEKISEATETRAVCVLRPGFAFVRGTLEVVIQRSSADADKKQLGFTVTSKGVGSSSEVVSVMDLAEHEGGTRVHWSADIQKLGGLLKAVPAGLIRGAAQKTIGDVWARVTTRLDEESKT
jgi:carbon monoxide dehydrogenase subunit G